MSITERSQAEYEAASRAALDTIQALYIASRRVFHESDIEGLYKVSKRVREEAEHYERRARQGKDTIAAMQLIIHVFLIQAMTLENGVRRYLMNDKPRIWMDAGDAEPGDTRFAVYYVRNEKIQGVMIREERKEAAGWFAGYLARFPIDALSIEPEARRAVYDARPGGPGYQITFHEYRIPMKYLHA